MQPGAPLLLPMMVKRQHVDGARLVLSNRGRVCEGSPSKNLGAAWQTSLAMLPSQRTVSCSNKFVIGSSPSASRAA